MNSRTVTPKSGEFSLTEMSEAEYSALKTLIMGYLRADGYMHWPEDTLELAKNIRAMLGIPLDYSTTR